MLLQLGDAAVAIPLFREDLAGCRATLGDDHKDTSYSLRNLVGLLSKERCKKRRSCRACSMMGNLRRRRRGRQTTGLRTTHTHTLMPFFDPPLAF